MIVFDLSCRAGGHVFEAWFGSNEDYEEQRGRGLVECPMCGSGDVGKAPMAPALARSASHEAAPDPKAVIAALAAMQQQALSGSTWVGDRFAEEARAIHLGERDEAKIHGRATLADARSLAEEGIPVAPLPLPIMPPDEAN